jgi:hypothetical protein
MEVDQGPIGAVAPKKKNILVSWNQKFSRFPEYVSSNALDHSDTD